MLMVAPKGPGRGEHLLRGVWSFHLLGACGGKDYSGKLPKRLSGRQLNLIGERGLESELYHGGRADLAQANWWYYEIPRLISVDLGILRGWVIPYNQMLIN